MRLLFCASGRFPDDQGWECDMGLHPHIVDVDVHDREHSWESHLKGHRQTESRRHP